MSFSAKIEPEMAMIGNPILVKIASQNEKTIRLSIHSKDLRLFEAAATPDKNGNCTFSIEDIFRDSFSVAPPTDGGEPIKPIPDAIQEYSVTVLASSGSTILAGKCYPGGISRKLTRFLAAKNTDIFTSKLCNPRNNFFMTTRTATTTIPIRETELGYLHYIGMETPFVISDLHQNSYTIAPSTDKNIYALNLPEIRKRFFRAGTLSSFFRISVNNKTVATVVITAGNPDALTLLFKNSFGVYEKIELSGKITVQHEIKKQETLYRYDDNIREFTGTAERATYIPTLSVESGYKTAPEFTFLQDLLLSEDIYIINAGELIRVMVSAKMKYKKTLEEPTSTEVKITFCDEEQYSSAGSEFITSVLSTKTEIPILAENKKIAINKYLNNQDYE